jgi:hypothetical protein
VTDRHPTPQPASHRVPTAAVSWGARARVLGRVVTPPGPRGRGRAGFLWSLADYGETMETEGV